MLHILQDRHPDLDFTKDDIANAIKKFRPSTTDKDNDTSTFLSYLLEKHRNLDGGFVDFAWMTKTGFNPYSGCHLRKFNFTFDLAKFFSMTIPSY